MTVCTFPSFLAIFESQMNAHLSDGERRRMVSMTFNQGTSTSRIASIITWSIQTVYNVLNLFLETNDL